MDEFDFDKLFADKMRRAGAPDLSDEDWERLTPRLDAVQRQRWRILPLWWLGALTGLLLCSNFGWWWMWQQSEKKHETLRNEWQQMQQTSLIQRDTTWSKVVVYQYDTIYRTVVYRSVAGSAAYNSRSVLEPKDTRHLRAENTAGLEKTSNQESPVPQQLSTLDQQINQVDTTALKQGLSQSVLNTANLPIEKFFLKIPSRNLHASKKDLALTHTKPPRQPLHIPIKFRIGAGGGFVVPSAAHFSGNIGFVTALTGELAFSERLALTLEGAYIGVSFKGAVYDQALGLASFPTPGDDYVLKHFETDEGVKPILQLGAGFRYWLRPTHKFSPYLGLGYAAQWHPEFELKLEYVDSTNGVEEEFSIEVPSLSGPVSLMDFNAGLRYRFFRHFSLQTGAFYQFKIDKNQPGIPRYWGLKSSVFYEFLILYD